MDKIFQCPFCMEDFSSLQRVESHLKRKISCINSKLEVPEKITLGDKILTLKPNLFPCQYCKKTFASKDNVSKHIKLGRCPILREICLRDSPPAPSAPSVPPVHAGSHVLPVIPLRLNQGGIPPVTPFRIHSIQTVVEKEGVTGVSPSLCNQNEIVAEDKSSILEKQIAELREKSQILETQMAELKEKPMVNNQVLQVICIGDKDNYLDMLTEQWGNFDRALEYIKDCALSSLIRDCKLIEKIYLSNNDGHQEVSISFVDKTRTNV